MDPVEEKHQARRTEERVQWDLPNITLALFWIKEEKKKEKDNNQNSTWLLQMFHKILRMLYLICIDVNLLNNNRELLSDIEE